jgi:hypothetical protein
VGADAIERFALIAQRYCDWAEGAPGRDDRRMALALLLELLRAGMDLPDVEPSDADAPSVDRDAWERVYARMAAIDAPRLYGTADPSDVLAEALTGDLHDDLADVWSDLREGLALYDAGARVDAAWQWRFGFENHWGRHAAEALRVLVARTAQRE